jgi:hypothetical protein
VGRRRWIKEMPMPRHLPLVLALVVAPIAAALAWPSGSSAEPAPAKRNATHPAVRLTVRPWHGYGFLPGYRPPEQIEAEDRLLYWRRHPSYWYGWPGYYRGRWNGGGFGPCYTQTPIGNVWNCGK